MKDKKIMLSIAGGIIGLACIGLLVSGKLNVRRNNRVSFDDLEKSITKEFEESKKEMKKHFEKVEKELNKNALNIEFNNKDMKSTNVYVTIQNVKNDDENISSMKVTISYQSSNENDKKENVEVELKIDKEKATVVNKDEVLNSITNEEVKEMVTNIMEKCINEKLYMATNLNMQYSYNKQTNK